MHLPPLRFPHRWLPGVLFWLPIGFCSLLLVFNTLPYFNFRQDLPFIAERGFLFQNPVYATAFYVHIAAGALCIAAALVQFSAYVLKKQRRWHRYLGRLYVFVVLCAGAPTGLYMAFFAKGGPAERGLFLCMALAWAFTTYKGLTAAVTKRFVAHKAWMVRSYAMALTAVSFRVYHIVFYLTGWNHLDNYEFSLWLSVIGNAVAAEWVIQRRQRRASAA